MSKMWKNIKCKTTTKQNVGKFLKFIKNFFLIISKLLSITTAKIVKNTKIRKCKQCENSEI